MLTHSSTTCEYLNIYVNVRYAVFTPFRCIFVLFINAYLSISVAKNKIGWPSKLLENRATCSFQSIAAWRYSRQIFGTFQYIYIVYYFTTISHHHFYLNCYSVLYETRLEYRINKVILSWEFRFKITYMKHTFSFSLKCICNTEIQYFYAENIQKVAVSCRNLKREKIRYFTTRYVLHNKELSEHCPGKSKSNLSRMISIQRICWGSLEYSLYCSLLITER